MSTDHDKLVESFREETNEMLSQLEASLLDLERDPKNSEAVSSIFRVFHSIKGSGGMCGFDNISRFTHEIETVYELVRAGKITPVRELVDITLSAGDVIRTMLVSTDAEAPEGANDILAALRMLVPEQSVLSVSGPEEKAENVTASTGQTVTYRIRFKPNRRIFESGTNPLLLLNELRLLGECILIAHTENIPELDKIDPELCYTSWDVILTSKAGMDALRDVFIFVEDESELEIEVIDEGDVSADSAEYKRLGEILLEKRDINAEDLASVLGGRQRLGEVLVEKNLVQASKVQSALTEQQHVRDLREGRLKADLIANVKVASDKLDKLVNLVGELVTVQARLSQLAASGDEPQLVSISEEVERLTSELRDNTMSIRMLPIGTTFSRFRRLVRDLSRELGKEVELTTEGAETELDKTVIEKLGDPLVHLIRNCIDHGIETPEAREKADKPRKGRILLSAAHSGPNVLIRVSDDGAGMDGDAIHRLAIEKGLVHADAELSEKEVLDLVLLPGFSTSENVTSISGRGVGLDVLKKAIESFRGTIDISSAKGQGTTITLSLPLTLAIIEGLLIRIAEEHFVLPLSSVEECVELISRDNGSSRHVANVRGQIVPYIRLREQFDISGDAPEIEQIVIVRNSGVRVGFVVDFVIGEHQTVIKTLGRYYRNVEGISGATILGDGTVALILDVPKLIDIVEEGEVSIQA